MALLVRALPLLVALLAAAEALAQTQPLPPPAKPFPRQSGPQPAPDQPLPPPKAKLPPLPLERGARLEALFERLRDAPDDVSARRLEAEIEKTFAASGSATLDLMLARAGQALARHQPDMALDLIDYAIRLKPRLASAYHLRATAHMMRKDEEAALRDLKTTLGLEPRYFPSIALLAQIFRTSGDKRNAHRLLTRLREIDPRFPELDKALESLRPDIEGRTI